ncbi:MAG: translocation and assembly module TamA [Gammaproteobacteria bacterium]|jgi:translocation and assembly module TamA
MLSSFLRLPAYIACIGVAFLIGCSSAKKDGPPQFDAGPGIAYSTEINGLPERERLMPVLERSLRLYSLKDREPSSLARLRRRAKVDRETTKKVLRSEGYYSAEVGLMLEPAKGGTPASVTLNVVPGPRYRMGAFTLDVPELAAHKELTLPSADTLGLSEGAFATAASVVGVERDTVRWLRAHGFPYAKYDSRTSVADPNNETLNVVGHFIAGPRMTYGPLRISGLSSVQETYLDTYVPWTLGQYYSAAKVTQVRRAWQGTGLFEVVRIEPVARKELPTDVESGPVPLTAVVEEAKHRSFGLGLRFSTDEGPAVNTFVEHRNLFGANETGRLSAIAALYEQELSATYRKPQFLQPEQALFASASIRREIDDAFDEASFRLLGGIERQVSPRLRVSVTASGEVSSITGANRTGTAYLLGLPMGAFYDASDDRLDPTKGFRLRAEITPYVGTFAGNSVFFPVLDLGVSAYLPIGKHVLAARGRWASILLESRDAVPPNKRLFAGGGGSVRGYSSRSIGDLDAEGEPIGGRSAVELGIEARIRVTESIGVVPFFDAGVVGPTRLADLGDRVQYSAGLGVRYFTSIGPIRADLGFPLNRRVDDDFFQLYISIGQAF